MCGSGYFTSYHDHGFNFVDFVGQRLTVDFWERAFLGTVAGFDPNPAVHYDDNDSQDFYYTGFFSHLVNRGIFSYNR